MQFLIFNFAENVRNMFLGLATMVYKLLAGMAQLFFDISTVQILDNPTVSAIYQRVGLILGLFMLFKLTFSFIQMVVDPDQITDKEKGIGGIIKKVMVVVLLLGMTPTIFKWGFELQEAIIKDNTIGNVILGTKASNTGEMGKSFAINLFASFADDETRAEFENGMLSGELSYGDIKDYMEDTTITGIGIGFFCLAVGVVALWMFLTYTIATGARIVQLMFLELIAPIPIISYISSKKENGFTNWVKQCITTYMDLFIRMAILYLSILMIQLIMADGKDTMINQTVGTGSSGHLIYLILILGVLIFMKKAPQLIEELFPGLKSKASLGFGITGKDGAVGMAKGALGFLGGAAVGGTARAVGRVRGDMSRKKAYLDSAEAANRAGDTKKAEAYRKQAELINRRKMAVGAVGGALTGLFTGANIGRKSGLDGKIYEGFKTAGNKQVAANQKYNDWRLNVGEDAKTTDRLKAGIGKKFGTTEYSKMMEQIKMMEFSTQTLKTNAAYGQTLKKSQDDIENRAYSKLDKGETKTVLSSQTMDMTAGSDDAKLAQLIQTQLGIDLNNTSLTTSQAVGMAKSIVDTKKAEYEHRMKSKIDSITSTDNMIASLTEELKQATNPEEKENLQKKIENQQAIKVQYEQQLNQIKQASAQDLQQASANYNEIRKLTMRNHVTQVMNEEPGSKSEDAVLSSMVETYQSNLDIANSHIDEVGMSEEDKAKVVRNGKVSSFKQLDDSKVVYKNTTDRLNDKVATMENEIADLKIEAEKKKANDDYYSGSGNGKK